VTTCWIAASVITAAILSTSDATGAINLDEALPAGRYTVRIAYAGDATHAPTVIEQEVTVR
jgi:hypothetical protein